MHCIWISLLLPGMLFLVWQFPDARRRETWKFCIFLAAVGILGVISLDLFRFFSNDGNSAYSFKRILFALLMTVDFPLLAFTLGSLINWVISKSGRSNPPTFTVSDEKVDI